MVKLFPSQPQWSTCKTGQLVLTTRTSAGFLIWSIQLFCAFPRRVHHTTPLDSSYFHTKCHGCHPLFITHNWILYKIREHLAFCPINIRTIKISCSMFSGSVSWGSALHVDQRRFLVSSDFPLGRCASHELGQHLPSQTTRLPSEKLLGRRKKPWPGLTLGWGLWRGVKIGTQQGQL